MWQRLKEAARWVRQELSRVHQEETARREVSRWSKGLDATDVPLGASLDDAEAKLARCNFEGNILTYIAGIWPPRYRNPWPMTKQISEMASSPLYRLAAVRMLAHEGPYTKEGYYSHFGIDALQLYAWTGFQKEMLPWNPLFAFVNAGTYPLASLFDQSGLQRWIENASDDELRAVQKWHSQTVEHGDPELHKRYIEALTRVGLDRLLYILEVISDPEYLDKTDKRHATKENIGRLTTAIAQCAASRLKVSQDGTISAKGFFSTSLVKGPIDHRP